MGSWIVIILCSIYILVACAAMFYIIRRGLGSYLHGKRQTRIGVNAAVKERIEHHGFHAIDWQMGTVRRIVVFECEDGEERDFDVPDDVWDWIEEGDAGELTFQGHHFIGFQCHQHKRHLDKTFKRLTRR